MNVELLRKVKDSIGSARDIGMGEWYNNECGTTHCIGGWAIALAFPELELNSYGETLAAKALRLSHDESESLFYLECWPEIFLYRYYNATNPQDRKQAVLDRIDYFIQTDGLD